MDQRLSHERILDINRQHDMEPEVDAALHMVVGAFLGGEARALSLLKNTFDRSSASNLISVQEMIRGMPAAKNIQDVVSNITTLDRAHQADAMVGCQAEVQHSPVG